MTALHHYKAEHQNLSAVQNKKMKSIIILKIEIFSFSII